MTATLTPPRTTPAAPRPRLPSVLPAVRGREGVRLEFENATWADYERFLADRERAGRRYEITYDRGHLEVELKSTLHETLSRAAHSVVESFAAHAELLILPSGAATLLLKTIDGGCEADESYYIRHFDVIVDVQDVDFEVHPPPDLAVEIDLSPPSKHKESVYSRLGVPEIWRWRDGRLRAFRRGDDGAYGEFAESVELPGFPLGRLAEILAMGNRDRAAAVAAFRADPTGE